MYDIFILIAGLALILAGANYLVDGSSSIARKFGLSDFIVGITIVAIGTSAPEMAVSFISAVKGNTDMAVGNAIGSNIFNTLVILGLTATIFPIGLTGNNIRKDIPFGFLAAAVLCVIGLDKYIDGTPESLISRTDGILLLLFFTVFMVYTLYSAKAVSPAETAGSNYDRPSPAESLADIPDKSGEKHRKTGVSALMIIGGLAGLIYGGDLFIGSAGSIARKIGISEAVIAITLMAGGTSLPELASSLVAAYKKKTDLALGNILGSNIANIFLILGGSAVIRPLGMENIGVLDLGTLLLSSLLIFVTAFTFQKKRIDRPEGIIFLILYVMFIVLLIKN